MEVIKKMFLLVLAAFIITGCSSDDNDPVSPQDEEPPEIAIQPVTIPQSLQNSNSPAAREAIGYINMANSFTVYNAFFIPPDNRQLMKINGAEDDYIQTWEIDGVTITMRSWKDARYGYWEITLNGSDGVSTFVNWKMMEGRQTLDGTEGYFRIYDENTNQLIFEWEWYTNVTGDQTVTFKIYSNDIAEMIVEILARTDNSGYVKLFDPADVLEFELIWNADGTGSYTHYDDQGNIIDSGTF